MGYNHFQPGWFPSNHLPNLKRPCDTIRTSHQNTTVLDVGNSGPASVARHSMESVSWLRRSTVHPRWRIGWRAQPTCLSCSCWSTDVFKQKWSKMNLANKLPFNATSKRIQGYNSVKEGTGPKVCWGSQSCSPVPIRNFEFDKVILVTTCRPHSCS